MIDRSPDPVRPEAPTLRRSYVSRPAAQEVPLAQQLYTFWNPGRQRYLDAEIDPRFGDNTLPPGRRQGPAGPAAASKPFRAAVPDLTCELSD
ncbi:lipoprotein, partial [Streptomyces rubellomurinus subsp. indigoferus]